jgi:hypothetical protein
MIQIDNSDKKWEDYARVPYTITAGIYKGIWH